MISIMKNVLQMQVVKWKYWKYSIGTLNETVVVKNYKFSAYIILCAK